MLQLNAIHTLYKFERNMFRTVLPRRHVKTTCLFLPNQLIQDNERTSTLFPQVVARSALNFIATNYSYIFLLIIISKFKKQLGLPFEGGIELKLLFIYTCRLQI